MTAGFEGSCCQANVAHELNLRLQLCRGPFPHTFVVSIVFTSILLSNRSVHVVGDPILILNTIDCTLFVEDPMVVSTSMIGIAAVLMAYAGTVDQSAVVLVADTNSTVDLSVVNPSMADTVGPPVVDSSMSVVGTAELAIDVFGETGLTGDAVGAKGLTGQCIVKRIDYLVGMTILLV